jgi:hypothetical protein
LVEFNAWKGDKIAYTKAMCGTCADGINPKPFLASCKRNGLRSEIIDSRILALKSPPDFKLGKRGVFQTRLENKPADVRGVAIELTSAPAIAASRAWFAYRNKENKLWYVVDVIKGKAAGRGETLRSAIYKALTVMDAAGAAKLKKAFA